MPFRQLADAPAQSNTAAGAAITAAQTSVTLQSASGFPAILTNGQLSVTLLDGGNPAFNPAAPLATPFEYQQVNGIAGNVLTFGPGGGTAQRVAYASTTPRAFLAGSIPNAPIIAAGMLAEDIVASSPWKFDDQSVSAVAQILIPAAGSIPASYLGITWRHLEIRFRLRTGGAANGVSSLFVQFDGDTSANYAWGQIFNNPPSSVGYNEIFAQTWMALGMVPQAGSTANMFGEGSIHINDYTGSQIKKARGWSDGSYGLGTPGIQFALRHGIWNNAAAITSLRLFPSDGTTLTGGVQTYLIP